MNNREHINQILNILYKYIKENKCPLTKDEIYKYLMQVNVNPSIFGNDIGYVRKNIVSFVEKNVNNYLLTTDPKNCTIKRCQVKNQGNDDNPFFTHMNVSFKGREEAPARDVVKLYIPLGMGNLEYNLQILYSFLFENKINFQSKLSNTVRSDLFVLRVDTKEDALSVIDFCNSNPTIKEKMGLCNPFVPSQDQIGVAHDTYGIGYNGFVAETISKYLKFLYDNGIDDCNLQSFAKYIEAKATDPQNEQLSKGNKLFFMYKELASNMKVIDNNTKPLDSIDNSYNIGYDHDFYKKYKRYSNQLGIYQYKDLVTNTFVFSHSDDWLKLQAMNFLNKLYEYQTGGEPKRDFVVSDDYIRHCLALVDDSRDDGKNPSIPLYQDPKLNALYPYFCSYLALKKRDLAVGTSLSLASSIDDLMIKDNEKKGKSFNNINFMSNVPIINIENASVGIELLYNGDPNIKGLCNITVIKDGKLIKYNNVFLDLDYTLLYPNKDNMSYAALYRASLGHSLADLDRNKRMMETRNGHFGIFKFSENIGVKHYYDPGYISKIAEYRATGLIPEDYQEEEKITK